MEKNWVFKKKTSPVGIFGFIVILGFIVFFFGGGGFFGFFNFKVFEAY